jgi:3-oxoacyl-(acyl-carrier-protein) synthase
VSDIFMNGLGAVSPAGWGMKALREALAKKSPLPTKMLVRPGWKCGLNVRQVPAPETRPEFMAHSRLRRTSPITHHVVAAALEAIGPNAAIISQNKLRLGVVLCVMSGCVNYSRRFYDEVLRDPATASPLVFPETVFNAPASHIAALLGTPAMNYTLVGDPGTFLQGLALGAQWLTEERVDGCVVIGAEEADWLTSDAFRLFSRQIILSDGAGALYLSRKRDAETRAQLRCVTNPHLFLDRQSRAQALKKVCAELPPGETGHVLVDGLQGLKQLDAIEADAWKNWPGARRSPKIVLGEGLMAAAAWQCVTAVDALREADYTAASVSIAGCNQQAIGAHFIR